MSKAIRMVLVLFIAAIASAGADAQPATRGSRSAQGRDPFSALHDALDRSVEAALLESALPPVRGAAGSDSAVDAHLAKKMEPRAKGIPVPGSRSRAARARLEQLRPLLEPILREEGIPSQMVAVVLVESGGRIDALSPKGARGLWQIMPETARRYGLLVSDTIDERLNPYKSTRAAARYLRDLYERFGNWELALAAYNTGEDAVQHAVGRTSSREFASLVRAGELPLETRNYVLAVLSAMGTKNAEDIGDKYVARLEKPPVEGQFVYAVTGAEN